MEEKKEIESMDRKKNKRKPNSRIGLYFLGSVFILYIILFFLKPEVTKMSLKFSGNLFVKLIPIVFIIIILMGLLNWLIKPKTVSKYVGKGSGIKGWILSGVTGILSHGPIYVWYPLLKELKNHGMKNGLVAVFLYNRSIKIPLLPLMIYYFGVRFVVVVLIFTVIGSIIEGLIIDATVKV